MICPFCKIDIDNDSLYCDQCGKEILICPKCNTPGKGKRCTSDGTSLISMKEKMNSPIISDKQDESSISVSSQSPVFSEHVSELHLINKNLGLDIKITKDTVIGRVKGDFVDIFSKYPQVSGEHLKIIYDSQKGWMVTDLGSTNGTKYNNLPLQPMNPQILNDKSFLIIANIEFYVQIISKTRVGKTGTMRI